MRIKERDPAFNAKKGNHRRKQKTGRNKEEEPEKVKGVSSP